jgi:hypothetical protein
MRRSSTIARDPDRGGQVLRTGEVDPEPAPAPRAEGPFERFEQTAEPDPDLLDLVEPVPWVDQGAGPGRLGAVRGLDGASPARRGLGIAGRAGDV